jgi:hypothetical protein
VLWEVIGGNIFIFINDNMMQALEELNEASAPLKYVLGEEEGRNLREQV